MPILIILFDARDPVFVARFKIKEIGADATPFEALERFSVRVNCRACLRRTGNANPANNSNPTESFYTEADLAIDPLSSYLNC